ncbi:late embryogenesis abundant protein D-34-like isoform X1 [Vicia villosa]|uniref:late embryogenesis abundant protein D-34-like isoform X1 n=1 Tax=Vicia villosa TaxID=3911 RepID=UPI00273CEC6E|nr:late embryogenesis abundant protein D-34-like isoform X1 [Vicia villosa]
MSQEQPRRPEQEPIKYGDVFNVSGELSSQPIAPRDAATMQSAENKTLGQTRKDGAASLMTSAAHKNEDAGFIGHNTATYIARNEGVAVSETYDSGKRVITETLGGQVLGKFVEDANDFGPIVENEGDPNPLSAQAPKVGVTMDRDFISNQGGGVMNPRLSGNQNENKNAWSNDSMDKGVWNENPEVISSVPGGMGASMATADRFKKNK